MFTSLNVILDVFLITCILCVCPLINLLSPWRATYRFLLCLFVNGKPSEAKRLYL